MRCEHVVGRGRAGLVSSDLGWAGLARRAGARQDGGGEATGTGGRAPVVSDIWAMPMSLCSLPDTALAGELR